jgi:hypothetical protein
MLQLWSPVAARLQEWSGTVIVDLGRVQMAHPVLSLLQAADTVLLLAKATVDGLFHARERVQALETRFSGQFRPQPMAVVVRAEGRGKGSLTEVSQVLRNLVPVIGGFADDPAATRLLLNGTDTAQLRRSALMRSAAALATKVQRLQPSDGSAPMARPRASSHVRLVRDEP